MNTFTPLFKLSTLHLSILHVLDNASEYYPDHMDWQDVEQGQVCREFAELVESWSDQTRITCEKEESDTMLIYRMKADDVPFSLYKNENYCSLIFNGHSEIIQQSTYDHFMKGLNLFFDDLE